MVAARSARSGELVPTPTLGQLRLESPGTLTTTDPASTEYSAGETGDEMDTTPAQSDVIDVVTTEL